MLDWLSAAWHMLVSIPHLVLYLSLLWAAYLALLGGWIVLQKREPVATLSWLMGLALLPYLGFIIYQVFGPQKIKRHRRRRNRHRPQHGRRHLRQAQAGQGDEFARLGQATTDLPPSTARSVRLLVDGAATYAALLEDIAQAREHIHIEYYIFENDRTGTLIRDALVQRARAGVKVRVLVDAVGSPHAKRRFFAPLIAAGGEFARFHPPRFGRIWTRTWVNMRTHRKIVVIDDRIGYTGGINVTDEENDGLRADAYRDLHLRLDGEVVHLLQTVFVEDWMYATQSDALAALLERAPPPQPGAIAAQVLPSGPDSSWEAIHRLHVGVIHAARRRVWLATPYFVPGEAALMALTSAALGGLDVRLLVPRRSDSRLVTLAARSYYDELMAAGVKVYEYGPRMLHTKALLVDDDFALIGSANFDNRSFRLNFEVSMLFHDADIAAALAELLESEFPRAPRVHGSRDRPLFTARLPEAIARLGSPLL